MPKRRQQCRVFTFPIKSTLPSAPDIQTDAGQATEVRALLEELIVVEPQQIKAVSRFIKYFLHHY